MSKNKYNPPNAPEYNNNGGEQTDKDVAALRKISLFLDAHKGTDIDTSLNTINNTGNFLSFIEQLTKDKITSQLGRYLNEIYKIRFADENTHKPIILKIVGKNTKSETIKVKTNLSDTAYTNLQKLLYSAINEGKQVEILEQGQIYTSVQKTIKRIIEEGEIYEKIYTELGGDYSNLQNLCVLFFGDFRTSRVVKNYELLDFISETTIQSSQQSTKKLQESIFLEILYRYIYDNVGRTTDIRFIKDIKNVFKTKKIYFSIYSGDTEYDDTYPLTYEYEVENVVLFIIELQYFKNIKNRKYYIDISGTPQKGNIVTNNLKKTDD